MPSNGLAASLRLIELVPVLTVPFIDAYLVVPLSGDWAITAAVAIGVVDGRVIEI